MQGVRYRAEKIITKRRKEKIVKALSRKHEDTKTRKRMNLKD